MEKSNKINSSKELIENISNKINNRNYRSYSVSNNDVPLNFVPTIKPKYIIFEEKDPFFYNLQILKMIKAKQIVHFQFMIINMKLIIVKEIKAILSIIIYIIKKGN